MSIKARRLATQTYTRSAQPQTEPQAAEKETEEHRDFPRHPRDATALRISPLPRRFTSMAKGLEVRAAPRRDGARPTPQLAGRDVLGVVARQPAARGGLLLVLRLVAPRLRCA